MATRNSHSASAASAASAAEAPASQGVEGMSELHVREGTDKEGIYFKPQSKLMQRLFEKPVKALRRRSHFLRTPWWARNGHVNTLVSHFFRGTRGHPGEGYKRMSIKTDDGGTISVDVTNFQGEEQKTSNPFVVMIAGLGGSSADPYTLAMSSAVTSRGWKSAVLNMRGTGEGPVTSGRLFSARRGSTDDVRHVIKELKSQGVIGEAQPVFGIGWSLGGCIMNNTILEQDDEMKGGGGVRIEAAAALGAPYDLQKSSEVLKPFPNWVYSARMGQGLVKILKPVAHNFDGVKRNYVGEDFSFDAEKIYASKSIREFDEALTAPYFGFASATQYYNYSSPGPRFSSVSPAVPLCIISGKFSLLTSSSSSSSIVFLTNFMLLLSFGRPSRWHRRHSIRSGEAESKRAARCNAARGASGLVRRRREGLRVRL